MVALLDYPALVHDHYAVGTADRRETVGDHQRRAVLQQLAKSTLYQHLGVGIDVGRRLVEHQYPRTGREGPGEADELPLPQAQVTAALLELRVVALRQSLYELVGSDDPGGPLYILVGDLIVAVADVLPDRAREEDGLLHDDTGLVHE